MSRVDVIVPCYNYGHLLEYCVNSVLSQEDVAVRVLIMDDASTDTTAAAGRRLAADPRVEYRRHEVNRGHIATYNEALAMLTGQYCVLLSADDLLTPGSLGRATRLMDAHPEVGVTFGRDITFRHSPPAGAARQARYCVHRIFGYAEFLERACRLGHTGIQAPTVVVRTALHRAIGDYLPELPHSGDTEIWLRMAAHAAVCELDADQAFRRLHANNMSLAYPPLQRLEEQKRAFAIHFDAFRTGRPEIAPLERVMRRTIAESGFWSAARAFDDGDLEGCGAFLSFAAKTSPDISAWKPWRRFTWKRRVGRAAWRMVEPVAVQLRTLLSARTAATPADGAAVGIKRWA